MQARRREEQKANTGVPPGMETGIITRPQMMLPDGTDIRQVKVITRDDWNRIQRSLNTRALQKEEAVQRKAEREEMRLKSLSLHKNWTNTIAGARQKKLEARKIREQKDEEERKQIDIEEAKLRAQKRKEAIEKAKIKMYYNTDRVKTFHSALRLTEVLNERDQQLKLSKLQTAADDYDKHMVEEAQQKLAEDAEKERATNVEARVKRLQTRDFVVSQITEKQRDFERQKLEDIKEGQRLKELATEYEMEKQRLTKIAEAEKLDRANIFKQQINDVRRMKNIANQQDEYENDEIRMYAAGKRKMMRLRAAKEQEIMSEKQAQLDKIQTKLENQLKLLRGDEEERLAKAVGEREEREAQDAKAKAEKHARTLRTIEEHRKWDMQHKQQMAQEDATRDQALYEKQRQLDHLWFQNEEEKTKRKAADAKAVAEFQLKQHADKAALVDEARYEDKTFNQRNLELMALEEAQFQEYAGRVIDHCASNKRNIVPLVKVAKGGIGGGEGPPLAERGNMKPSYRSASRECHELPTWKRDESEETKRAIYGNVKSNKRLGFVYD